MQPLCFLFFTLKSLALITVPTSVPDNLVGDNTGAARIDPTWRLLSPATRADGQCGPGHGGASGILRGHPATCPLALDEATARRLGPARWAPWTHAPYCANSSYCVFTNAALPGGLSIVATPESVASAHALLAAAFAASPRTTPSRHNGSAWEVRPVPGKGRGMVAKRHIPRGETFLVDRAAVVASVAFPGRTRRAAGNELLGRAAAQLPRPDDVLRLARSSTQGAPAVEDVMRTNTFALQIAGEDYMGLFPTISRINHACAPKFGSAQVKFDEATMTQKTTAVLDIQDGDEITISYAGFGMTREDRQATLLQRWGFRCTCALCSAPAAAVAASDARRRSAMALRDSVLADVEGGRLASAVALSRRLIAMTEREGLATGGLAEQYEVMARLYMALGDPAAAAAAAAEALAEMAVFGGRDAYTSFDELDRFVAAVDAMQSRG